MLVKTTAENDTSPNHTWWYDPRTWTERRVQWRKDKRRAATAQFKAAVALRDNGTGPQQNVLP